MRLNDLVETNENINIDDYLELYNNVRDNMSNPEWLGTFTKEEIENILNQGGKIWLYYDRNNPVCSVFYMPVNNKTLNKYKIDYDEKVTGSLGPIMVRKEYIGNGLQNEMLKVLDNYIKSIGKSHIFTKTHSDNIYSIRNLLNNGYKIVDEYENERGKNKAFIK